MVHLYILTRTRDNTNGVLMFTINTEEVLTAALPGHLLIIRVQQEGLLIQLIMMMQTILCIAAVYKMLL